MSNSLHKKSRTYVILGGLLRLLDSHIQPGVTKFSRGLKNWIKLARIFLAPRLQALFLVATRQYFHQNHSPGFVWSYLIHAWPVRVTHTADGSSAAKELYSGGGELQIAHQLVLGLTVTTSFRSSMASYQGHGTSSRDTQIVHSLQCLISNNTVLREVPHEFVHE